MTKEFSQKMTIIAQHKNGGLENYPYSNTYTFEFDSTDLTVDGYVEQFRTVLRAVGFAEKTITEALGEF
jgi:hypothetical protein